MKKLKVVFYGLALLFAGIQFIRPAKNISVASSPNDVSTKYNVPPEVQTILRTSCYDCHSNNTRYPWYAEVQPIAWLISNDVEEGTRHLNFSEFGGFRLRRQYLKLEQIVEQMDEGEMPPPAYTWIHSDAKLSRDQREQLIAWANATRDSMKRIFPIDSLERSR